MNEIEKMFERKVSVGEVYQHYFGHFVQVIAIAKDCCNYSKEHIVYRRRDNGMVITMPKELFIAEVDHELEPHITQKYVYRLIKDNVCPICDGAGKHVLVCKAGKGLGQEISCASMEMKCEPCAGTGFIRRDGSALSSTARNK